MEVKAWKIFFSLRPIGGARGCLHPLALLTESGPELVEGPKPAAMEAKAGTPESGDSGGMYSRLEQRHACKKEVPSKRKRRLISFRLQMPFLGSPKGIRRRLLPWRCPFCFFCRLQGCRGCKWGLLCLRGEPCPC